MPILKNIQIRHKLTMLMMFTCLFSLLVVGSIFIAWGYKSDRQNLIDSLSVHAEMIADNCNASVAFDDPKDTEDTLSTLRIEPSIVHACIYTGDGKEFAGYYRENIDSNVHLSEISEDGYRFDENLLTVFKSITVDDKTIASVCLRSDLQPLRAALTHNIYLVVSVIVCVSLAAYLLSVKLQQIISSPILSLTQIARRVSRNKEYSVRAEKKNNDEIGELIDSFNDMLEQIQNQKGCLVEINENLERKVKERTRELTKEFTDRKKAEDALIEHAETIHSIINTSKDWIWSIDLDGIHRFVSPAVESILGYLPEELIGQQSLNLMYEEDRKNITTNLPQWIKQKSGWNNLVIKWRHKDGGFRYLESNAVPILDAQGNLRGFRGVDRDITERMQAEKEKEKLEIQLRQSQKMQAIGTLAGGIAHDFNNILGALIGYAVLANDDIPEGTRAHQNQQEVLIAANRAKELIKQILAFSRKDKAKLIPMQIDKIIQEALKLLRSSLSATIQINQEINCNSSIMADETQIHQVLLNLGTNAAHAMAKKGGVLDVILTNVNIDSDTMTCYGNLKQGSYVKLAVSDTGCGISEEIKERIFEPFFTTKEVGKGTGMGLSVVHGIVENHYGVMTIASNPGGGTIFEIFFPCVEGRENNDVENSGVVPGQGERILFIDDERSVVTMTTLMLQRIDYKVVGETDSIEALKIFQENPYKFDLVITDQAMPKMKGTELAKELMKIRPEIPIILCSGYSENIDSEKAKAVGIKEFFMKPVNREEISQIIREILDKREILV